MGWQSIETAPKDGTIVDLWYPEYGRITDQWYDAEDGWFTADNPTYWMPVPEQPGAEAINHGDRLQMADFFLIDPESGAPCFVVSTLRRGFGGLHSFDMQSGPDAPKWRVEVRITECGATGGRAALVGDGEQHVGACPAVRTAPTRQGEPASTAPKLIGWRSADYTMETSDPDKAKNWSNNMEVLPIFEGDPNTKLPAE